MNRKYGTRHAKICLWAYADSGGPHQHVFTANSKDPSHTQPHRLGLYCLPVTVGRFGGFSTKMDFAVAKLFTTVKHEHEL